MRAEEEPETRDEQDVSDTVELRFLGSTFKFYGNIWKSERKETDCLAFSRLYLYPYS